MVTFPDVTLNDMMRKVLSSTAGATFHEETPTFTINIKKEMIELIYKLAPSWYVIVNVFHASEKELMLCCEWGHYFDRLKNPAVQMPKIEKNCPTLYGILVGKDPDNVVDMYDHADSYSFGYRIPAPNKGALIENITHEVINAGLKLANKNLQVYRELFQNPPFPAWKDALNEVWN